MLLSTIYDMSSMSVTQREAFNNTIMLLSMVKSENYYIIGFSRPKQQIEIGYDLPSNNGLTVTQSLVVDFSDWDCGLTVSGTVAGLPAADFQENGPANTSAISCDGKNVFYQRTYPTDSLLPHSVSKMDRVLQASKNEILHFLSTQYSLLLQNHTSVQSGD